LERAFYFAAHGYVFALVDVRGRGNSGGSFEPFANDARDGYNIVEWLAQQTWCNGKVAMWGGSYAGFDQWTSQDRRLLRRDGPDSRAVQAHRGADPDHYGPLRRRSTGRADLLQPAHAVWKRRSKTTPLPDHRPLGPCGHENAESGGRRLEVRLCKPA